jgi:serine/threonine protein kinase
MSPRNVIRRLMLPYESIRTLYEGQCDVHLCRNEITGAEQVVKAYDTMGLDDAVAAREATLLTSITHPNVVNVFDVAEDPDVLPPMRVIELVMEFLPRGSVCDAFERGEHFSLGEAVRNASAALRGLGELHEAVKVLHRDVKSPNLLLAEDQTLMKVGDLGLAVPLDADGTAEAYPTAHLYTPPETYVTQHADRSSDLYGLGLTLLEMANDRPFPYADYSREWTVGSLEKGRRPIRGRDLLFEPHVPRRLKTIITKAIARRPEHRYQRATEMSDALAKLHLIDWRKTVDEDDFKQWQGASVRRPDREYMAEARRRKRGGRWALSGLQKKTSWRRVVVDQVVADAGSDDAASFFESILSHAASR